MTETIGPRKNKTIQMWAYDPTSKRTVQVAEVTRDWQTDRVVDVWDEAGEYLGRIESYESQTQTHLYGNVASFGKPRTFWHVEGDYYGTSDDFCSQAGAIRTLIRDRATRLRLEREAAERAAKNN